MKKLLILLLLFPVLSYGQRRVDTLFVKKGVQFDSLSAPAPTSYGKGYLISRGISGLFYVTGNSVSRIDSGFSGGGGTGLTSLNGLTTSTQTFTNDSNVTITSVGGVHTIGWTSPLGVYRGGTGVQSLSNILGTASQITVTNGTGRVIGGNVTLTLPQNIDTAASFKAGSLRITNPTGEIRFGPTGGNNIIIAPQLTPTASKTYYLPEISGPTGMIMVGVQPPISQYSTGIIGMSGLSGMGNPNTIIGVNAAGTFLEYKYISAGTNINVTHTPLAATINLTGTIAVSNGGTNLSALPSANRVLAVNTGGSAYVGKVLVGTGATSITNSNDTITITTSAASGEANTASNKAGAGIGVYKTKTGVDLEFKRIKVNSPLSITDGTDSVVVSADTSILATQYDIPISRDDTVLASLDTLAITVSSVTRAMASVAGTTSTPPIPLRCYVLNSTTIVVKFDYDLTVNQPVTIAYWR
jgi:hypothetical protein